MDIGCELWFLASKGFKSIGVWFANICTLIVYVDDSTKIVVVDFIKVSFVGKSFENEIQGFWIREQIELVQNSKKLIFCDISLFGDIEILEVGFDEHSFVLNSHPILLQDVTQLGLLLLRHCQIITSRWKSGRLIKLSHFAKWILINPLQGENGINAFAKSVIIHMSVWNVINLIVLNQDIYFFFAEVKIIYMQNPLELGLSNHSFS